MSHTGFGQTIRDYGRLGINFRKSLVDEVLPEHFAEDYPNLVTFLDAYYEHLDSADNFGGLIEELQTIRDFEDTKLKYLDLMFDEVALGVSQSSFVDPREALRNFGNFFRVKGSQYSVDGFFRAFFNEEVEVIHPKDNLFRVGNSFIGHEYAQKLQDGRLNQILSIFIKGPIPLLEWEALYRNFVHPSGFFLGAAVVIEGLPELNITTIQSEGDDRSHITNVYSTDAFGIGAVGELVGALGYPSAYASEGYDGADSDQRNPNATQTYSQFGYATLGYVQHDSNHTFSMRDRYNVYRNINDYPNLTVNDVLKYYDNIYEWSGFYQSFDDYADSANASAIRFSSTLDDYSAAVYFRK